MPSKNIKPEAYSDNILFRRFFIYLLAGSIFLGIENTLLALLLKEMKGNLIIIMFVNILFSVIIITVIGIILFKEIHASIKIKTFLENRKKSR